MRSDIVPGARFPDYELPDENGRKWRLSRIQGPVDTMVLLLARGHYCPKESQQALDLAAFYPKLVVGYTKIATISTDAQLQSMEFKQSVGAQWPFLSDPGRTVQQDLQIKEYTDPEHNPMIPHTLVLGPNLTIFNIYNGYFFWGRPSTDDLWRDLRALNAKIRSDWDLCKPELESAWEHGDRTDFFPYHNSAH